MEAFTTTFTYNPQSFQLPFSYRNYPSLISPPISINLQLSKPKPFFKIKSSQNPNPFSLLKTPLTIAVASTAIFFSGLGIYKPFSAVAEPPKPPSMVETLNDDTVNGLSEEKVNSLEDYIAANPKDIEALKTLMEVKIKLKKLPEAVEVINKLIDLEPEDIDWLIIRSHMYSYIGEFEMAKTGFKEIIDKNPARVDAFHGLVMAVSQGEVEAKENELEDVTKRVEEAMERCKKVEEVRDFKLLIAQIRVIEGNYVEALKVYEELVKEEPMDYRPYLCQGIIYTLLKKKDEAEEQFDKYKRLVPVGHPYASFFDDELFASKVFSQIPEDHIS